MSEEKDKIEDTDYRTHAKERSTTGPEHVAERIMGITSAGKATPVTGVTATIQQRLLMLFEFIDTVIEVIVLLVIFLLIQYFIVSPFIVSGGSMESTLQNQELILVNKIGYNSILGYSFGEPHRGDVIVFHPPTHTKEYYIKRIIGIPGDTVSFKNNAVYVNDKKLIENYTNCKEHQTDNTSTLMNSGEFCLYDSMKEIPSVTVPADSYFVMGDNRNNSSDSRTCFIGRASTECRDGTITHFVPKNNIIGRAWVVLWPFSKKAAAKSEASIFEKFFPFDNPRTISSFHFTE